MSTIRPSTKEKVYDFLASRIEKENHLVSRY